MIWEILNQLDCLYRETTAFRGILKPFNKRISVGETRATSTDLDSALLY